MTFPSSTALPGLDIQLERLGPGATGMILPASWPKRLLLKVCQAAPLLSGGSLFSGAACSVSHLGDPDLVAERIAQCDVRSVRLLHRLLRDLDVLRLQRPVSAVDVVGGEAGRETGGTSVDEFLHLRSVLSGQRS